MNEPKKQVLVYLARDEHAALAERARMCERTIGAQMKWEAWLGQKLSFDDFARWEQEAMTKEVSK